MQRRHNTEVGASGRARAACYGRSQISVGEISGRLYVGIAEDSHGECAPGDPMFALTRHHVRYRHGRN